MFIVCTLLGEKPLYFTTFCFAELVVEKSYHNRHHVFIVLAVFVGCAAPRLFEPQRKLKNATNKATLDYVHTMSIIRVIIFVDILIVNRLFKNSERSVDQCAAAARENEYSRSGWPRVCLHQCETVSRKFHNNRTRVCLYGFLIDNRQTRFWLNWRSEVVYTFR